MEEISVSTADIGFGKIIAYDRLITRMKNIMGSLVNTPLTNILGWVITALVIGR